jgi:ABC-type phosphate/phosphonate transport system permease subunit
MVKSTGQIGTNLISIFVTYQVFQVFPFDFSASAFNWEIVTRVVLILTIVGAGIGMLTEAYKLASYEPEKKRR